MIKEIAFTVSVLQRTDVPGFGIWIGHIVAPKDPL